MMIPHLSPEKQALVSLSDNPLRHVLFDHCEKPSSAIITIHIDKFVFFIVKSGLSDTLIYVVETAA